VFHSLKYTATFTQTGRTLSQNLTLTTGFWAITGPNESGKSFIFEMMRYALFGVGALRARTDTYSELSVEASFAIRGVDYRVVRSKKVELYRGKEVVASGTRVVNEKICQLLGFGLAVFDIACSINQGEVERLGTLTPNERKRLVDSVLGIDALDLVSKWAMEEARDLDRDAEAIKRTLTQPMTPTKPEDYAQINLAELTDAAQQLAEVEGFLAHTVEKPIKPTTKIDLPAENIRVLADKRRKLREEVEALKAKLAVLPTEAPYTLDQLEAAAEQWTHYNWQRANPRPPYTETELKQWEADWNAIEAHKRWEADQKRLTHVDCPNCNHTFPLQTELDYPEPPTAEPPPIKAGEVARFLTQVQVYDFNRPLVDKPEIPEEKINLYRAMIGQVAERDEVVKSLATKATEFERMVDFEAMLAEREAFERAIPVYQRQVTAWNEWNAQRTEKEAKRMALAGARERLTEGQRIHSLSTRYDQELAAFKRAMSTYAAGMKDVEDKVALAKEYRKVRDVMNVLRSLIKQHIIPSLNAVASHLLTQMTGGQRTKIYVDEEFNVTVDQQDLDTLSGSGKACANLALRIALGQVLTNKVFSVMMADEIDASMDEFRADETAKVYYTLDKSISQVFLISHKAIEAVNHICLGESVGRQHLDGEAA